MVRVILVVGKERNVYIIRAYLYFMRVVRVIHAASGEYWSLMNL